MTSFRSMHHLRAAWYWPRPATTIASSVPSVIKIDPQRRIIVSSFYGEVTDEQLVVHRGALLSEPLFNPDYADLVDFSAAASGSPSPATLQKLATAKSIFHPQVPHVIIAAEPLYAVAKRFQEMTGASRPNLHVVRTIAEAYAILEQCGYGM